MADNTILELSDDEFMKLNSPESVSGSSSDPVVTDPVVTDPATVVDPVVTDPTVVDPQVVEQDPVVVDPAVSAVDPHASTAATAVVDPATKDQAKTETTQAAVETATDGPDYKAFYEKVLAPLNANGKTITIQSAEEAIQLMQMGANYTKKMQQLAPYRKMMLMLENNGLMDEAKLGFLIDLDKRNPEAIKKLVKEAGIDPLDIDVQAVPSYQPGNHSVSDAEVAFTTTLEDLQSAPNGKETLQEINSNWDKSSIDALWNDPSIMRSIHEQRQSGVYDLITTEVARMQALGQIPVGTPFLTAYRFAGDALIQAKRNAVPVVQAPAVPVATRVAAPKPVVTNSAQAAAAASTPNSTKPATAIQNPLAMSDEDFLKAAQLRV